MRFFPQIVRETFIDIKREKCLDTEMVLEYFASDSYAGHHRQDPVPRDPKINYFRSDVIDVRPIVSHISSNGYYGYCSPAIQTSDASSTPSEDSGCTNRKDDQMEIAEDHLSGHQPISMDRKRSISWIEDDDVFKPKRRLRDQHFRSKLVFSTEMFTFYLFTFLSAGFVRISQGDLLTREDFSLKEDLDLGNCTEKTAPNGNNNNYDMHIDDVLLLK